MNYAIIAAGEGSRLRQEGFKSVKPLVKINGEYLIERLIRIFCDNDARSVSVIINEQSEELREFLNGKDFGVKINLIVKSTPSSLHSFWNIVSQTGIEECCLTTVDTVFSEKDFASYIKCFQSNRDLDALMAVTSYVDDEKPLYIQTDGQDNILAFCDDNKLAKTDKISAGIYCLRSKAIAKAGECIENNVSRMRNYQRSLTQAGLKVKSFLFSKVIDLDHVTDIAKAESLLQKFEKTILCVKRYSRYSPNSQDKDGQILNAVIQKFSQEGYQTQCIDEMDIDFQKQYYPYVLSMARNENVIQGYTGWEKQGSIVINSSAACLNCYRERQIKILQENNISIPHTLTIRTDGSDNDKLECIKFSPYWIKRGDFQTINAVDVIKVEDVKHAEEILKTYFSQGITSAVLSENIDGDIIKFYGLSGTDWFWYYYPKTDKFENKINTTPDRTPIDREAFALMCRKAAEALDLEVYGGDAAVDAQGLVYIIDMNDFPSFSACRDIAAENIAKRFIEKCSI